MKNKKPVMACPHCGAQGLVDPNVAAVYDCGCGQKFSYDPASPPVLPATAVKRRLWPAKLLVVFIALVAMFVYYMVQESKLPEMNATIRASNIELLLRNDGYIPWRDLEVTINGSYTFREFTVPAGGELRVPLSEFIDSNGNRFRPETKKVTRVMATAPGFQLALHGN